MPNTLIKREEQAVVAGVVAVMLIILAVRTGLLGGTGPGLVNIERARSLDYAYLVDLNRAAWPELAELPEVGEVLARRIVASRIEAGPFTKPEDLLRVNGIGPRRLERIRGNLLPLPGEAVVAEGAR